MYCFIFCSNILTGQEKSNNFPISIGYFSNYGFQPGVKVGTPFRIKNWETERFAKSYFISPQVGFYSWIGNDFNVLVNAEIGHQRFKNQKNTFSAFSIGLGYLAESEIISFDVNLSDGNKEKNRELRNHFLTTINYEFGKKINSNWSWYGKPSWGWKLSDLSSMVVLIELGLKFNLK
ncbi:MAG: hypothetical protein AAF573_13335 [Bacteroidota bacterium]